MFSLGSPTGSRGQWYSKTQFLVIDFFSLVVGKQRQRTCHPYKLRLEGHHLEQ
ncbi:hypothetical protein SLEP1_g27594 [Rubroshorea leprosula]|uniref:Uncharacterized protein n=1 Tax=Rubroshorea leprosula TaxID=152421 RepID=A0AAV5JXD8_9ROSI|nr:hypothetical protein SLEP1_g27594 [Rubroshorea leprosula]